MDGKLIILCGERPTINEYGERIDEKSHLLVKKDGKYFDMYQKEVNVDEHKKIINGINLLNDMITESTEPDMIFVDWESIVPSNIEPLQEMIEYAHSTQEIPPQIILDSEKNQSVMKRAHLDRLLLLDESNERPSIDYQFQAMEDFFQLFSETLEKNGVVSILPTFPNSDTPDVNRARLKVIQTWKDRNSTLSKHGDEMKIDVLEPMSYDEFGEIYSRAIDERLKILSKPDWYDMDKPEGQDEGEPGGRG